MYDVHFIYIYVFAIVEAVFSLWMDNKTSNLCPDPALCWHQTTG